MYTAVHVGDEGVNGDTEVTLQYSTEVFSKGVGDLGGISPFRCFCSGLGFISFQTMANILSWALRVLQIHQTNRDLEVPMPFHQGQRELRYAPASTSSGVHIGTDQKAGRSGFLEDPGQTEMVSRHQWYPTYPTVPSCCPLPPVPILLLICIWTVMCGKYLSIVFKQASFSLR